MNDDEKDKDKYQGVPIQRLPTIGQPLSIKSTRWRGNYVTTRIRKGSKSQVKKLVKELSST